MSRIRIVLLAVGLLVIGFSVVDTQAARHRHRLTVKHYFNDAVLPASNDPTTNGVASATVTCPRGYRATGGGYSAEHISLVPHADLNPGNYNAIAINQTDTPGKLTVTVACVAGRTRVARARADGAELDRLVRTYRAERRR
jgi:hypothetical protein